MGLVGWSYAVCGMRWSLLYKNFCARDHAYYTECLAEINVYVLPHLKPVPQIHNFINK